jgi:hypothetical protein
MKLYNHDQGEGWGRGRQGEINREIIFLETSSSEKCRPIALGCLHMLLRI